MTIEERVDRLEQQNRNLRCVVEGLLLPVLVVLLSCCGSDQNEFNLELDEINKIERVRKHELPALMDLITEDEKGRPSVKGKGFSQDPRDPWGTPYEVRWGDKPGRLEIVSAGPDKLQNTDDDISSRDLNRRKKK